MKREWNENCCVEQDNPKNGNKTQQKTMIPVPYTDDLSAYLVEDKVAKDMYGSYRRLVFNLREKIMVRRNRRKSRIWLLHYSMS